MATFWVRFALGGGFGGVEGKEWEEIRATDMTDAQYQAEELARDEYDSYDGLHGLRSLEDIMEEDGVEEDDARLILREDQDSWLEYEVSVERPNESS